VKQTGNELSAERRALLARKGRELYADCSATGGTCAEGFALHHIDRGETVVALDLLAFLDEQIAALRLSDPDDRLTWTEALAARIREHLHDADQS
jgi:hypothetical protein